MIGPIDFARPTSDKKFLVLTVVVLVHRRVRGDPRARRHDRPLPRRDAAGARSPPGRSASIRTAPRMVAFALSAAIAGLGGGLMASYEGAANVASNFSPLFGLVWVVLVVSLGPRTVEGAIQGRRRLRRSSKRSSCRRGSRGSSTRQPWYHMSALPAGLRPSSSVSARSRTPSIRRASSSSRSVARCAGSRPGSIGSAVAAVIRPTRRVRPSPPCRRARMASTRHSTTVRSPNPSRRGVRRDPARSPRGHQDVSRVSPRSTTSASTSARARSSD